MDAVRTILDHAAACWHCSKRLQACDAEGNPARGRGGQSPNYRGSVQAYVAEIDGHPRRLHKMCAAALGFRMVKG